MNQAAPKFSMKINCSLKSTALWLKLKLLVMRDIAYDRQWGFNYDDKFIKQHSRFNHHQSIIIGIYFYDTCGSDSKLNCCWDERIRVNRRVKERPFRVEGDCYRRRTCDTRPWIIYSFFFALSSCILSFTHLSIWYNKRTLHKLHPFFSRFNELSWTALSLLNVYSSL